MARWDGWRPGASPPFGARRPPRIVCVSVASQTVPSRRSETQAPGPPLPGPHHPERIRRDGKPLAARLVERAGGFPEMEEHMTQGDAGCSFALAVPDLV